MPKKPLWMLGACTVALVVALPVAALGPLGPVSLDPASYLTDDGRPILRLNWLTLEPDEIIQVGIPTHANVLEPLIFPIEPADEFTHPEKECIFPYAIEIVIPGPFEEPRGVEFVTVFQYAEDTFEELTGESLNDLLHDAPRPLSCFLKVAAKWGDPLENVPITTCPAFVTARSTTWMSWWTGQDAQISDEVYFQTYCDSAWIPPFDQFGKWGNPKLQCTAFPYMMTNYCETHVLQATPNELGQVRHSARGGFSSKLPNVPCWKWSCPNPIYNSGRLEAGVWAHESGDWGCTHLITYDRGWRGFHEGVNCQVKGPFGWV